ncbi:MAG TPA: hypothetical protein VJ552_01605 [Sediminibacterium sp.]|nr:hypothetical protein [Sediminibacterium sp.]
MKKVLLIGCCLTLALSSCRLLGLGGASQKAGCPSNGKNVGAEKLLSGDGKVIKAPKYKKGKSFGG